MQSNLPIIQLLQRLLSHINPRFRKKFGLLLTLTFFTSLAESVSIAILFPFLGVLASPELIFKTNSLQPIIKMLGIISPSQLLLPLTIFFGLSVLIAGVMRLLLLWATNYLSYAIGSDLSKNIYRRTLYQPYRIHCERNSSEVISGISSKTANVINVIYGILILINSTIMLIVILVALLSINAVVALATFSCFGLIYLVIIRLTTKRLLINSQISSRESTQVIKSLQEGLGGIRDILIDGSQATYCQIYNNADQPFRRAQGNSQFISQAPRYAVEALSMLFIAILAYVLTQQADNKAISILGALALGAQRLLPLLQQAYAAWSGIKSSQFSLQDSLELLDQPLPKNIDQSELHILPFKHNIELKQLSFRYNLQTPYVLKNININILKGSRVGFVGATGSGKSTLLDIVMGLLSPTNGTLTIDGRVVKLLNQRAWQTHIAHVPQTIFLADSSIEENIAFGIPKDQINHERVRQSALQAQILDSIESWPKKYQTIIGERGIRLSGGQRQRIGIARALYKQASVIIFDEATSALDSKTENAVMNAIESLDADLTLLIIAHRLTTLKNCTQIIELSEGGIKSIGSYQDILNRTHLT
jgi:ABC-type bacteriocin/lantibiotic exporter with double-glycine peptidase domain